MVKGFLTLILVLICLTFPVSGAVASELEDTKALTMEVEEHLDSVHDKAVSALEKGELCTEAWKAYSVISWHGREVLHIMTMAVLFYEEAPNETHRGIIAETGMSMIDILMALDDFCTRAGIEVEPPSPGGRTACYNHGAAALSS